MSVTICSDVSATVWKVEVAVGDRIEIGDVVAVLEAMKMEIPIEAEVAGLVTAVHVGIGDGVEDGQALVTVG